MMTSSFKSKAKRDAKRRLLRERQAIMVDLMREFRNKMADMDAAEAHMIVYQQLIEFLQDEVQYIEENLDMNSNLNLEKPYAK